ncbi:Uncharacterised protein [Neisseria canis]|uniref:Uncharacterized protein n=1 Tax=Neisseria canis TaxID=493 RepID=A0A3S4P4P0_9NEIS|nr:Uncharacterised protein [Neisseria canis]
MHLINGRISYLYHKMPPSFYIRYLRCIAFLYVNPLKLFESLLNFKGIRNVFSTRF